MISQVELQQREEQHKLEVKSAFSNYSRDALQQYDHQCQKEAPLSAYYKLLKQGKQHQYRKAVHKNQQFLDRIIQYINITEQCEGYAPTNSTTPSNHSKIKTTLKQFYRQWSKQSQQKDCIEYIVQKSKKYLQKDDYIVVPGCGLGRLVLELVANGFGAQGNEVTYFMLFGSNFILNCVGEKEQFTIYPFIHSVNYYYCPDDMFRSITIPEVCPEQVVPQNANFSISGGEFIEVYSKQPQSIDSVATCFFIDTANNIFDYIDTIHSCLKQEGIWVNYGPLLFHYREVYSEVSVEVSWQQVQKYISTLFDFLEAEFRETTYDNDAKAEMRVIYKCVAFVCKKKKREGL